MLGAAGCGENEGAWLCNRVTTFTENETAADVARWLSPWVTIALILLGTGLVGLLQSHRRLVAEKLRIAKPSITTPAARTRITLPRPEPLSRG